MKFRHIFHVAILSLSITKNASSVQLFWNAGDSGIWGTGPADKNWNSVFGAISGNVTWDDPSTDAAILQNSLPTTITVFDQVQASGITLNGANHSIEAGTITLVRDSSNNLPYFSVDAGTLTINTPLAGSDGVIKKGSSTLILNGNHIYTGVTEVTEGIFDLAGTSLSNTLQISSGATFIDRNAGLLSSALVNNAGKLTINTAETITSYTQNGSGILNGSAALTVTSATLNGGTVAGSLLGNTISTGEVLISGSMGGGSLDVTAGTLNLTGTSTNTPISIYSGASLIDANGGLAANAVVTNAGTLTVNSADTISSYTQNGSGILNGSAALTVTSATLNGGTVAGSLLGGEFTTRGNVSITGNAIGQNTLIADGTVTNSGTFGAINILTITSGATIVAGDLLANPAITASGTGVNYTILDISGNGVVTWQGNLINSATISPRTGTLNITGNFTNQTTGINTFTLGDGITSLLQVNGTANLGGTLSLLQSLPVTPFVPVQIIEANQYTGNYSSLLENIDGAVWFNPTNGTVMSLALPQLSAGGSLYGSNPNQTAVWISLYDDAIDSQTTNISQLPNGKYDISSGIANGNVSLINSLAASFSPGGLNGDVLNRLSPESYAALGDYAIHATRTHQRTALEAPAISRVASSSKSGKETIEPSSAHIPLELFAAIDTFGVGADSSINAANYDLFGAGFVSGLRGKVNPATEFGAYFAGNEGNISGNLLDGDTSGWSLGAFGRMQLHAQSQTRLTAALSYGRYDFYGSRTSVSPSVGGWTQGNVSFADVTSDALDINLNLSSVAWSNERFLLTPSLGMRYVAGSMDNFTEQALSNGTPVALAVSNEKYHSLLLEISLRGEMQVSSEVTISGVAGFAALVNDDENIIRARFVDGSRPMNVMAPGIENDALFLGTGVEWRIMNDWSLGLNWRSDFREGAKIEYRAGISASVSF